MEELVKLSPPEALEKFKNAPEDVIAHKLHFGLGRWIYVFWNFEGGSRYVEFLRQQGLAYHDHMIQFTIVSLHRNLNGKPLEIEERVQSYQEKVRQDLLEKIERGSTIVDKDTIE
jgi:hypothetical protein